MLRDVLDYRNGVLIFIVSRVIFEILWVDRRPSFGDGRTGQQFVLDMSLGLWMRRWRSMESSKMFGMRFVDSTHYFCWCLS